MVNLVDRIHTDKSLPTDANGRSVYLEQFIYYVVREDIAEACLADAGSTIGRAEWIRSRVQVYLFFSIYLFFLLLIDY